MQNRRMIVGYPFDYPYTMSAHFWTFSDPTTNYVSYGEENILRKLAKPCEMNMGQDKLFMSGIDRIW